MHKSVSRGLRNRDLGDRYYFLSIDEKAVRKGHEYITILSDEQTGVVIEVVEGRTKDSVDTLCQSLSQEQRRQVKTVCTDMWNPFIYAAHTYFPQALHCHDNFHLVGYLNKAVDKTRKREVKKYDELKKSKYLFLKDKMRLTDKQHIAFESISMANYEVSIAWRIKENFRDIQFRQERGEALSLYAFWRMDAMRKNIKEVNQVIEMFDRHQKGIINAIQTGANNARAERLNGAIQELKTIGRGYRNTAKFRTAILFFHGNLELYDPNSH
jgi:transposase